MFDLKLCNATILDGTGAAPFTADIGITADTIADVGELADAASRESLDLAGTNDGADSAPAPGLMVAPGFVDAHTHSDAFLLIEPSAPSKIFQGVTTEVCGNCGTSAAPISDRSQLPSDWSDKIYPGTWCSVADYRERFAEAEPAVNAVLLVGHNTLRRNVMGYANRAATPDEMERMRQLMEQSMQAGARGLTTGLIYAPGMYAPREELVALATVAGRHGGIYGSHMRSEGARLIEALEETIAIGEAAGARIQVSHLKTAGRANWGRIDGALDVIRRARDRGRPVMADRYPYIAGATELDVVMPDWFAEGGRAAGLLRLADPDTRRRLRRELSASRPAEEWRAVTIGSTSHPDNSRFRGKTLFEVAEALGGAPVDAILHLCETDKLTTGAFFGGMSESNMFRILAESYVMLGSDASLRAPTGPLSHDYPHPRAYGSLPRFLRWSLDRRTVPLPEAIRKMTSLPAAQFGLDDRGVVAVGKKADLVVFDPSRIRDLATYGNPHQFSEGIVHLMVNGALTIRDTRLTSHRAGRIL